MKIFHTTIFGLILLCPLAQAQTVLLNNSATVQSMCQISTTNMNFGAYNPLDTSLAQSSASIIAKCTKGNATIKINGGNNATSYNSSDTNVTRCQRAMKSAKGDFVAYDLHWGIGEYNPATSSSSNPVIKGETCPNTYGGVLVIGFPSFEKATVITPIYGYIRNYRNDRTERSSSVDPRKARPGTYSDSLIIEVAY